MGQAVDIHRLHFAFTITFHYIFPQLTMGLALLLVYLKTKALRTGDEHYSRAARFWARIFGINFALGVVTGIPMEFQFGTNWSAFSKTVRGLLHRCDSCVDATSERLLAWRQRGHRALQLLCSPAEQVGLLAVRTHDAGRGANQLLRHGRGRRFLFADEARCKLRPH